MTKKDDDGDWVIRLQEIKVHIVSPKMVALFLYCIFCILVYKFWND